MSMIRKMSQRRLSLLLGTLVVLTNLWWIYASLDQATTIAHLQDEQRHLTENTKLLIVVLKSNRSAFSRTQILDALSQQGITVEEEPGVVRAEMTQFDFNDESLEDVSFPIPL